MANPTTLQMRQQEIHRPFQPLDTTEGRAGRPIAAPQAQYAGGWNIIQDVTGRLASLYARTSGGQKDEEDPELIMAQDLYAQGAFDLQEQIGKWSTEDQQALARDAAAKGQTSSEYLKNLYDKQIQAKGAELGIAPRKLMKAREAYFKAEVEGLKTAETRQYQQTKLVTDELIKNGYGVYDDNANIDVIATRKKASEIMEANTLKDATFDEGIGKNLGFTMAEYTAANNIQRQRMDDEIANYAFKNVVNPLISLDLEAVRQAVDSGQITDVREAIGAFRNSMMAATQQINQSNDVPAGAKTRLLNDMQNISKYIETLEKQPDTQLKDLENAMTKTTLLMKARALQDPGTIGLITRVANVLPPELANTVIQSIKADPSKQLFDLASSVKSFDSTIKASNLTDNELRQYANITGNIANILEGQSPTYGTKDDQTKATAIALKYIQQSIINPEKTTPQQRMEALNTADYILNVCNKALRKDPDVKGASGEAYANFIELGSRNEFRGMLVANESLKQKFLDLYNPVTDSYLIYPSGPAGVLRNTTPTDDRWIAYDETSGMFVGGRALISGGTTGLSFNKTVDRINNAFKTKCFGFEVEKNREPDSSEKKQIADDIIKILLAANVDPKMFKSFK